MFCAKPAYLYITELVLFSVVTCVTSLSLEGWATVKNIPNSYYSIPTENVIRCGKLCVHQGKCFATTFDARQRMCFMHESCVGNPTTDRNTRGRYLFKIHKDKDGYGSTCDRHTQIRVPSAGDKIGVCRDIKVFVDYNVVGNIALNKYSWQSSTMANLDSCAANAVDGNQNPDFWKGTCTHTEQEKNPWWIVDLNRLYTVGSVVIVNRATLGRRLHNFTVEVASAMASMDDFSGFRMCSHYKNAAASLQVLKLNCIMSTNVRYVKIQVFDDRKEFLTLCEVEVYQLEK